ncbi:MAG: response regulator [Puniceicoccaceae bacterium]
MTSDTPRILIVDDTVKNIQVLGSLLKEHGYRVSVAQNGLEALDSLASTKPDLILMDVMMPKMDGYEACRHIKGNPETSDIPLIFLTAKTESKDIVQGFQLGAMDYVMKPFNQAELLSRVRTHIDLYRKSNDLETSYQQLRELRDKEKDYQKYIENENVRLDEQVKERTQELNDAHQNLQKAMQQLEQLDEAKDDFLKLIAHELRTPLHGMGAVELLICSDMTGELDLDELKEIFRVSYHKLLEIVEHARMLTELKTGIHKDRLKMVSFPTVVDNAVFQSSSFADTRKISLELEPGDHTMVEGSESELSMAFQALIDTAIRFSDATSPVEIGWEIEEEHITLKIEATGYTVPEKYLGMVFDVMSIGESIFPGGDFGLGPAVAKQVISLHGGSVGIENRGSDGVRLLANVPRPGE